MTVQLHLGLIGDHITQSKAPRLHRLAGQQTGVDVRYDSLIPADLGQDFEAVFAACETGGFRGINVTYPYKERAAAMVRIDDPLVRSMGAVNTVIFGPGGPQGHNTDHTGFKAAYARQRGAAVPGPVLLIGAGGVGRAIAFALISLGARDIRLADSDPDRAERLARDMSNAASGLRLSAGAVAEDMADGAEGVINCTPLGMDGDGRTPLEPSAMANAGWAFDSVYTPRDTPFLKHAARAGLMAMSGWDLFFYQGVHAWAHFCDRPLDEARLLRDLLAKEPT
ncbi:Quinate/shikimate dehydrogenase [Rhodobacteraceae bacterium THAF1]|uniref:shikimate dehydrogenase family protein n=1 Tax=Palleronia sp. THAF1 TaxID=2587842 RepID=UPI000F40A4FF|nr:shikimate dehydrogenase [Palleronia sp. THAF1]QFU09700.1 Quinate/shikimate dehydrogenase [Palleronia sp. THAF1]VDC17397.1 Quinate/shikimate dehydrogenase [Rhodobacteraceae bacterium THAF1]